jgi:hypothetical protein
MKKSILLTLFNLLFLTSIHSQEELRPFITTWDVPSEGSFMIPLSSNQSYDFEFHVIQEADTLFAAVHTNADGNIDFLSIHAVTVELHIYAEFPHFANYSKDLLLDEIQ